MDLEAFDKINEQLLREKLQTITLQEELDKKLKVNKMYRQYDIVPDY